MNIKWANERWTKTWKQTFMNRYIKLREAKTWFWVLRGCCQSREIKLTVTNWGDKNDICGRNIFSSLYRSWFQPLVGLNPPCLTLGGSVQKYSWVNVVYYPCNSTCLVITLWYESVFAVQTYNHTHMKPHRELLRCRSGRKTKEDRSERRHNQPWVLRKKHFTFFLPVFQLPPLISIFQSPPCVELMWRLVRLAQTDPVQGLNRQKPSSRCCCLGPTNSEMGLTSRQRPGCRVQLNLKVYCQVCVCVCVCRCYWEAWLSPERSSINCEVKEPEGDTRDLH